MSILDKIKRSTKRNGRKNSRKSLDIGKSKGLESIVDSYDSVRDKSNKMSKNSKKRKKDDYY